MDAIAVPDRPLDLLPSVQLICAVFQAPVTRREGRTTFSRHGAAVRPPGQTTELVMGPQGVRVLGSQEPTRDRAAAWRKVPGGPGTGWRTGGRFPRRWRPVNIGGPGAEAADPQGGNDLEMLRVTGRYRSCERGFGCHSSMFTLVMVTAQADRYEGTPGHPAGATPVAPPSDCNSLFKRGVTKEAGGGRSFLCRAIRDFRCCSGNHLREPPCILSQAP
jgi:hypothetical protein